MFGFAGGTWRGYPLANFAVLHVEGPAPVRSKGPRFLTAPGPLQSGPSSCVLYLTTNIVRLWRCSTQDYAHSLQIIPRRVRAQCCSSGRIALAAGRSPTLRALTWWEHLRSRPGEHHDDPQTRPRSSSATPSSFCCPTSERAVVIPERLREGRQRVVGPLLAKGWSTRRRAVPVRSRLRLEIKLPLKCPDTVWRCQAHRQSPILDFFESAPEVRVLRSAGITRPRRSYDPARRPPGPAGLPAFGVATSDQNGPPPITRNTFASVPCPLPRRIGTGASVGCFPIPRGLPRFSGGSASALHYRGLLGLHSRYGPPARSTAQGGLRRRASVTAGYPDKPPASYQCNRQLSGWLLPPLVIRALGAH